MEPVGKLELLFTHVTINNVHYVKPLIYEAIEEYQTLARNLTVEEQRKISILKEFLYHAENDKWDIARHQLHAAEQAYQEYFQRKNKILDTDSRCYGYQTDSRSRKSTSATRMTSVTPFTNSSADGGDRLRQQLESRQHSLRALSENSRNTDSSLSKDERPISSIRRSSRESANGGSTHPGSYSSSLKRISISQKSQRLSATGSRAPKSVGPKASSEADKSDVDAKAKTPHEEDAVLPTPTQVADQFRCIYDGEWIHAQTALHRLGVEKKDSISCLLHIVEECYRLCEAEAESQMRELESAPLTSPASSAGCLSQTGRRGDDSKAGHILLAHDRSKLQGIPIKRLQDTFLSEVLSGWLRYFGIETSNIGEIVAYVRQCIAVTWRMCRHTPPIHLISEKRRDDKTFNPNHYKCFTKYGQVLDFYVWPALLYNAGGPILAKGVAQSR